MKQTNDAVKEGRLQDFSPVNRQDVADQHVF